MWHHQPVSAQGTLSTAAYGDRQPGMGNMTCRLKLFWGRTAISAPRSQAELLSQ